MKAQLELGAAIPGLAETFTDLFMIFIPFKELADSDLLPADMVARKTLDMQGEMKKLLLGGASKAMVPKLDGGGLSTAMESLKNMPTTVLQSVKAELESVPQKLIDQILGAEILVKIKEKVEEVKKWIKDTVESAKKKFQEFVDTLKEKFNMVKTVFDNMEKAFKEFVLVGGESVDFAGLATKMSEGPTPSIKIQTGPGIIQKAVKTITPIFLDIRNLPDTIIKAMQKMEADIKQYVDETLVQGLKKKVDELPEVKTELQNQIENLPQTMKDIVVQIFQNTKGTVEDIAANAAKEVFAVSKVAAAEAVAEGLASAV